MSARTIAAAAASRLLIGLLRLLTGVQTGWVGAAPTAAPTVYFVNHTSHGDFVLVWAALPPDLRSLTRPVAAQDYWTTSALRRFIGNDVFRALMIRRVPAATEPAATPPASPVDQMAEVLRHGDSLIMFPEGTRSTDEDAELLPFKSGLYHLAVQCPEARLTPVWIENLRRVLPKGSVLPIPLACTVHFGAPLVRGEGEDKAAFIARAQAALLALRPDHAREPH